MADVDDPKPTQTPPSSKRGRSLALLVAVLAYTVFGFATAGLAGAAGSSGRTFWRLAGWLLPLATFVVHIWYDRIRVGNATTKVALHAATAVAAGALVIAAGLPVASHWGERGSHAWLSLVLWPIVTGVPAFVAALVMASILGRVAPRFRS
jgi:hypothetical protein